MFDGVWLFIKIIDMLLLCSNCGLDFNAMHCHEAGYFTHMSCRVYTYFFSRIINKKNNYLLLILGLQSLVGLTVSLLILLNTFSLFKTAQDLPVLLVRSAIIVLRYWLKQEFLSNKIYSRKKQKNWSLPLSSCSRPLFWKTNTADTIICCCILQI